jgi:phosphoribosylformylglycinamidine cyclo-ligase
MPSVVYAPAVLAAVAAADVHAAAHITGGGLPGNLNRVLTAGSDAVLERGRWDTPPIFTEIQRRGDVDDDEMARVFNLGLGMVLVVAPDAADAVLAALDGVGQPATRVGTIVAGTGRVQIRDGRS